MYEPSKAKTAVFGFRHTFFTLFIPPTIRLSMRYPPTSAMSHPPSAMACLLTLPLFINAILIL
jgi:hypothetical protein